MGLGFLAAVVTLPATGLDSPCRAATCGWPWAQHGGVSSGPWSTLVPSRPVPPCPEGLAVSQLWPP